MKKTTYKVECRTETYDTFRTECVPVCKEKVVSCVKKVPVWKEECRKVCHKVTVYEDRCVNKTSYKYVQETCMKKQLVRLGHWECKEVCPILGGGLFSGHGKCGNSCNDACSTSCAPATRTRKVWVHCPEYKECPVTVCKKVCVTEQVMCKVPVCKTEWREEKVKVCSYQCVTENKTVKYTCYESRQVACKATRTVRVCVPCETTVNCTKWVRQECAPACTTPASTSCGNGNCGNSCGSDACCRGSFFSGLRDRVGHCRDACRPTCSTSCCK